MRTSIFSGAGGGYAALAAAGMLSLLTSPSGHAFGTEIEGVSNCAPGWTAEFADGRLSGIGVNYVRSLATLTVGDETSLFASGTFRYAGGLLVNNIARWNGKSWSPLGKGFGIAQVARCMAAFDERSGEGPDLFVGGSTFQSSGVTYQGIARWDGTHWSDVSGGVNGVVFSLTAFDDGRGPMLYVGGNFTSAGDVPVQSLASWDGLAWHDASSGLTGRYVRAFAEFDDGGGRALYAVQSSPSPADDPTYYLARWNETAWVNVATFSGGVKSLSVFDDGSGPVLYAAGFFTTVDEVPASNIARWNGRAWSALGEGVDDGVEVLAAVSGSGMLTDGMYVGGLFSTAGGQRVNRVARWDGRRWLPLNEGCDHIVEGIAAIDHGPGEGASVLVGGVFQQAGGKVIPYLAQWDGSDFRQLGNGVGGNCDVESTYNCNGVVHVLTTAPDGPEEQPVVYVAGNFDLMGDQDASRIAAWDGSHWSSLGPGLDGIVNALTVTDIGDARPTLYATGEFAHAGSVDTGPIARWDGQHWSSLGGSFGGGIIQSICAIQAGPSEPLQLIVGGTFATAGGVRARNVAQWDGRAWTGFGDGPPNFVHAVTIGRVGPTDAPTIYAGGRDVRFWDGESWQLIGTPARSHGHAGTIFALREFDDGTGPALYAGGNFDSVDEVEARAIARWNGRSWSAVGDGFYGYVFGFSELHDQSVAAPSLVAVGQYVFSGAVGGFNGVARWDGREWHRFAQGVTDDFFVPAGSQPSVRSAAEHRLAASQAPSLFIGGMFQTVGGRSSGGIARWVTCPNPPSPGAAVGNADLNRDGRVDAADLAVMLAAWGRFDPTGSCPADLDHHGIVDSDDLMVLLDRTPGRSRE